MYKPNTTLLICPTYNAGSDFEAWLTAFKQQSLKPDLSVIVDSTSDDGCVSQVSEYGLQLDTIDKSEFNHGGTRQQAILNYQGFEYVIFATQDAIFANRESFRNILQPLEDGKVAAVCGRQLPKKTALPIEAHARLFNYPEKSSINSLKDAEVKGLKAVFLSNSFAAYRISALLDVGGFPDDVIFGEDMYVAAKFLKAGYKVAYAADACVYHSHDYSLWQEFRRYFDMGVFHANEPWIRDEFGGAEGEGVKFVISEIKYLMRSAFWRIPEALFRTLLRYTGFRLGLLEKWLPLKLKRLCTMNKGYFKN